MTEPGAAEAIEAELEEPPEEASPEAVEGSDEGRPRRMLDRYEIVAEIARGGMGTVLLGRRAGAGGFERLMAIKLMHEHLAQDSSFVAMLLDEARTAANISHPNAVGIIDVASSPLGYYLVMDYVEGFTLAQVLDHPELTDRQRARVSLRILIDACKGLHAAHTLSDARGQPLEIVHRDVSPQNVLVGLDGVGRIVDFGIALAASRMTHSRPGMLKGKPSYMAPEQVRSEHCDGRADVFALGAMAWEIVVGWTLFTADIDVATLVQVISAPIPTPASLSQHVSDDLSAVIMKALERDRGDRTESARAFALELERAAAEADLLASTHEVQDLLAATFAREIESKQKQVRFHLAAATGEPKPLEVGQMHLIPKLESTGPAARSRKGSGGGRPPSGSGVRDVDAEALTRDSGAIATDLAFGGVVQPSSAPAGEPQTPDARPDPAVDALAVTGEGEALSLAEAQTAERGGSNRTWIVAGVIAALAILGGIGVGVFAPFSEPEGDGVAPPVAEVGGPDPSALEEVTREANEAREAARAAEAELSEAREAIEAAEAELERAEAESETSEQAVEPAPPAQPAATGRRTRAGRRTRPASAAEPAETTPTPTPIENNPYLTR